MKKTFNFTGKVINFSGGKTSAYLTIREYNPGDIVLFCDTVEEHAKTYKFLNDFEAHGEYSHYKSDLHTLEVTGAKRLCRVNELENYRSLSK